MTKFKTKYGIKSNYQLIVIFIVFGITGSTAAFLSDPLMEFINIKKSDLNFFIYWSIRLLIITFVYQIILLVVAFVFGEFKFFWNFEKKMLKRIGFKKFISD
ncbi:MAG: diacylglyceryl transferase [Flavobacteriaceae bacterium TMED212]|nr:MAG: diacylglyceryl transferase [Flavobacteriaceae bacterium TMED212]